MSVHIDRSLRLPQAGYFPGPEPKTGIALHHTVGGTAASTIRWWRESRTRAGRPRLTGTAYVVERDGTVFEAFAPEGWAYQFGLTWPQDTRLAFERRFVGIELASEGALIERDGALYCFDRVSPKTEKPREEAFDAAGAQFEQVHTSGHASPDELRAFANNVGAKCVVPIHSFEWEEHVEHFPNVLRLRDGERCELHPVGRGML